MPIKPKQKMPSRSRVKRYALVLAAGQSKRFRSRLPKVLHPLCGKPLLLHILDALGGLGLEKIFLVVGQGQESVQEASSGYPVQCVVQRKPLGTGDAVKAAAPLLKGLEGSLLVLLGDTPLITAGTLRRLFAAREKRGIDHLILTTHLDDPVGYGRVVRDPSGGVVRIVEERDATAREKGIREINTGFHCFRIAPLLQGLDELSPSNAAGEYYLTDLAGILRAKGCAVEALSTAVREEVRGINNREELAAAESEMRQAIRRTWLRKGVSMRDPSSVHIDADVVLAPDTTLHPGVVIEGRSRIASGCTIGSFSHLRNAVLGRNVLVDHCSVVRDSRVGEGARIGPFALVRGGEIGPRTRTGSFVEIKNV